MKNVNIPDLSSVPTPDVGGLADDLLDLASTAADAVSSASGNIPGLDDYRAIAKRRRLLATVGVVAVILVVLAVLRRKHADSDGS